MAVNFASAEYAEVDSAPVATLASGITLNGWFRISSRSNYCWLMSLQDKDTASDVVAILFNKFNSRVGCFNRIGGVDKSRYTATALTDGNLDTWHMVTATLNSSSTITAYWNGGDKASTFTSYTQGASYDRIAIGACRYSSPIYSDGEDVAECSIWDRVLSDAEIATLYAGGIGVAPWAAFGMTDPEEGNAEGLRGYWRLLNDDGYTDGWGTRDLTAGGTPSYSTDHPPMVYPSGAFVVPRVAAATGAVVIPPTLLTSGHFGSAA